MRAFFIIMVLAASTGCGYQVIKKSDLEFIRKANYATGYMKCINTGSQHDKR